MWWGDVAHDQRATDAFSLVYDSEPLADDLEILGLPRAMLRSPRMRRGRTGSRACPMSRRTAR